MQPVLRNMREDMVLYRARPQGQSLCSHMEAEVDGGEGLRGQCSGQRRPGNAHDAVIIGIYISIAIGEDVYDTYAIRPRCILNVRARPSARETARPSAACDLRRF